MPGNRDEESGKINNQDFSLRFEMTNWHLKISIYTMFLQKNAYHN